MVGVPNNKFFASISSDRSIRLWRTADLLEKNHTFIRINVDFDYPKAIVFTLDSKALIVALGGSDQIRAYKLEKTETKEIITFPEVRTRYV